MCECCTEKKDIYLPQLATVEAVDRMNVTERYVRLSMDDGPMDFVPGQFVEVSIAGIGEAPITISSSPTQGAEFELVVRRIGNVTNAIHNLQTGDKIGIRGPLGKGIYPVEEAKGIILFSGHIVIRQKEIFPFFLDDGGQLPIYFLKGTESITFSIDDRNRAKFASVRTTAGCLDDFEKRPVTFIQKVPSRERHIL